MSGPDQLTASGDQVEPTPYPEANAVLGDLLPAIRDVLGDRLVGLYLYGSAARGAFDPGLSDVDLLAALATGVDDREFECLTEMHADFARARPEWDDHIEVQYLPLLALRTFKTQAHTVPVVSPGEPFHWREVDHAWTMNWYDVQENGIVLAGPDPRTLIEPISREEFVASIRGQAIEWRNYLKLLPRKRGSMAYVVLTMCRALYTCETGGQLSKEAAARWATESLPAWAPAIERALDWRRDAPNHSQPVDEATFRATSEFIEAVIARIGSQ